MIMNNGDICPYHGLSVLRLVDNDPNTWACDECWNQAKWYKNDKKNK